MPQHRYEGDSIESLLTEVRTKHGPDVEIIEAEKIRLGGFAGFFAHEGFALTVEVPDEPESAFESLLADQGDTFVATGAPVDESIPLGPAPELTASRPGVPSIGDRTIAAHQPAAGRIIDTGSGAGVPAAPAPIGRAAAIGALLNRADEMSSRERTLSGDAAHFRDVLRHSLEEAARQEAGIHADPAGEPLADQPIAPGDTLAPRAAAPVAPNQPAPSPTVPAAGRDIHPLAGWSRSGPDTGDRSVRGLVERLAEVRQALDRRHPDRRVQVTAVLGEPTVGLKTARRIATDCGLSPDSVVVGQPLDHRHGVKSWNLAPGVPQMIERSRHWRASGERAVVLLPITDLSPESIEITRALLDAMAPDEVRLVVPGTPPSFQLANLATELGRIDVLDLIEVDDAAGVLDLVASGHEVGSIEGEQVDASLLVAIEGLTR